MAEAQIRTEDLTTNEIEKLYVDMDIDKENINALKSNQPLLLIGSRGTGKTMLMRKAESEIDSEFDKERILAVYTNFATSAVYENTDITVLMINKVLMSLRTKLQTHGIIVKGSIFKPLVTPNQHPIVARLEKFIGQATECLIEDRDVEAPEINDDNIVKNIDYFRNFIGELCEVYNIKRIIIMFDEACQIFAPNQQRQFFEMFRALRSPIMICKAAVYPGLVSYGTFQQFHDVTTKRIERNILSSDYVAKMRKIVENNYPSEYSNLITRGDQLDTIIYCANGNPRFLLKSLNIILEKNSVLKASNINDTIKEFYRNTVWAEHTKLEERYVGHRGLISWSRRFIMETVLNDISKLNNDAEIKGEKTTIYFAISRKAPEEVKQAVKILEYSGIVNLDSEATLFRKDEYDRYQLNYGVVLLSTANNNLAEQSKKIISNVSQKKFPNYGENSLAYGEVRRLVDRGYEGKQSEIIEYILEKNISELDISPKILIRLNDGGISKIGDVFEKDEAALKNILYIGEKRSRKIYNEVMAAVIEYISG